ncbi:MAG: SOS response-associated peptidase family protein [Hyphomonadaceae bacterium]|nr:SOS response-associated peptidase family protein [Hyphomonadaceae bacterium]
MCNHYRNDIRKSGRELELFGYEEFSETKTRLRFPDMKEDLYPDRIALVARMNENGALEPDLMRWGFPPVKSSLVTNVRNTRSETTGALNNFWRHWLKPDFRCLVPATSFAEFSFAPPKGERWFEPTDSEMMCFAGIWRPWTGVRGTKAHPVDGEHRLFAFLTTTPNAIVQPIHPKAMPVILPRADWDTWLTGSIDEALDLQRPLADDLLKQAA